MQHTYIFKVIDGEKIEQKCKKKFYVSPVNKIDAWGKRIEIKNDIYDLEPNLAPIYYAGYLFIGSRHTTNPLAISKKIFQSFLQAGGEFINESVESVIEKAGGFTQNASLGGSYIIRQSINIDFKSFVT